jgi:membrane-associated progesterone receptor component
MVDCENTLCRRIKEIVNESENCINLLYAAPCMYTRNMLLYQLKNKIAEIDLLSNMMCGQVSQKRNITAVLPQQNHQNQREIRLEELSKYNGKDGNPAYVAVNGVVYDVTNNAAWAAASHFGLTAGKDLTSEFGSCHAGQPILNKLILIGKLV